jgi:hypothetical protein
MREVLPFGGRHILIQSPVIVFLFVHPVVCRNAQRLGIGRVLRKDRDADAGSDLNLAISKVERRLEELPQGSSHVLGFFAICGLLENH